LNDVALTPAIDAARGPRNAPCVCGSGRRYKACHGRIVVRAPTSDATAVAAILHASLAAQRAGRRDEARAGYEAVLAQRPATPDALAMLGVLDLAQGDPRSALRQLRRAVALFAGRHPEALHNLACVVSAHLVRGETERSEALYLDACREASAPRASASGRISVVVPSHDHAAYVAEALVSALEQDRPPDEVVVVDDGSSDGSVMRIRAVMRRHPGRIRLVAREGRGAAATINEAIALSSGDWINVLNSDDRFAPGRLRAMHDAIARGRDGWGFSRCTFIDDAGAPIETSARIDLGSHRALIDGIGACDTVGYAFLPGNPAISTGALFFARSLFERVGGFRALRYNHDWDFCLRATRHAEPAFAPAPLYEYRVHGRNTIQEPEAARDGERKRMLAAFYRDTLASGAPANRYAPSTHAWGRLFLVRAIERGHALLLPPGTVERLADEILARGDDDGDA
jgi:glycosyltransferase involved in cell wall biosynthesis